MLTVGGTILTTMLGLAATFLGLAILVQVVQECWKYLFSTKSAAYERALVQFIGPWARRLAAPGLIGDLQVDGPFQVWRRRPRGRLLPLEKDQLVDAMERTAPAWVRRALDALRLEAAAPARADGGPSPAFTGFLNQLRAVERGSPGFATASEVADFLTSWGVEVGPLEGAAPGLAAEIPAPVDAAGLLAGFRERFLGHVTRAERSFAQLGRNFDYIYKRRNTVLTFAFALALALLANLPVGRLYRQARAMSPEQAATVAETMTRLYDSIPPGGAANDSARAQAERVRRQVLDALNASAGLAIDARIGGTEDRAWLGEIGGWFGDAARRVTGNPLYLLECLATALLISFGAPFWNDLAGTLLRLQRGPTRPPTAEPEAKA